MTNPFEDDTRDYLVLINEAGQHSLWPAYLGTPGGWERAHGPADRASCLAYVEDNWTALTVG